MRDVLPLRTAGFVEVDVGVDATREHVQPGGVDLFAVLGKICAYRRDLVAGDRDIGLLHTARRDDRAAADDHFLPSSSRKRPRTSIANATSASSTDSAGLWLTPPLQRTNNMPMSVISDM